MSPVTDLTAAALKRACDKSDAGELAYVKAGTPLAELARKDPTVTLIDGDWLANVLDRLSPGKRRALWAIARFGAQTKYGRDDMAATTGLLFELLKDMDADGELEDFIGGAQ